MTLSPATAADLPQIERLIAAESLPADDVAAPDVRLWVARDDTGRVVGCVGLEVLGTCGLLRSLAVAAEHRGTGLGRRLTAFAESEASRLGIRRLYLLTTGDGAFFVRHGYAPEDRAAVPEAVRQTRQFSGLCPASARLFARTLEVGILQY